MGRTARAFGRVPLTVSGGVRKVARKIVLERLAHDPYSGDLIERRYRPEHQALKTRAGAFDSLQERP